jgi:hypothetical protein
VSPLQAWVSDKRGHFENILQRYQFSKLFVRGDTFYEDINSAKVPAKAVTSAGISIRLGLFNWRNRMRTFCSTAPAIFQPSQITTGKPFIS